VTFGTRTRHGKTGLDVSEILLAPRLRQGRIDWGSVHRCATRGTSPRGHCQPTRQVRPGPRVGRSDQQQRGQQHAPVARRGAKTRPPRRGAIPHRSRPKARRWLRSKRRARSTTLDDGGPGRVSGATDRQPSAAGWVKQVDEQRLSPPPRGRSLRSPAKEKRDAPTAPDVRPGHRHCRPRRVPVRGAMKAGVPRRISPVVVCVPLPTDSRNGRAMPKVEHLDAAVVQDKQVGRLDVANERCPARCAASRMSSTCKPIAHAGIDRQVGPRKPKRAGRTTGRRGAPEPEMRCHPRKRRRSTTRTTPGCLTELAA